MTMLERGSDADPYIAPNASGVLSSLTAGEIDAVREIVTADPAFTPATRFVYVGLEEPTKAEALGFFEGTLPRPERLARVMLLDVANNRSTNAIVSLDRGSVVSADVIGPERGQFPILNEEIEAVKQICDADERWVAALAARGTDPSHVICNPLSAGSYGFEEETGRRILRVLAFRQDYPEDHPWAHPIEGLNAYVDMQSRKITRLIDTGVTTIPAEGGNFDQPQVQGAPLEGLKPISITQPEGPSFTVDGESVSWGNWRFDVGFDAREGLILRRLRFDDAGDERPIIYRASVSEMVVPYGDPSPIRFWQNYFDAGEYLFGRYTNSLTLGCDCVGEITYFDVTMSDETGHPVVIENGLCMHEEDFGTLWKHTDAFAGSQETRRSRRLVISTFTTVGNYDYGFYWYLYLDGTIELEAKLTGILFTSGYSEESSAHASEVAPGLGAPFHQHLFNVRLDMTVDGLMNAVDEIDAVRLPVQPGNEYGEGFTRSVTRIQSEQTSGRVADGSVGRAWVITNTEKKNRLGRATGYALFPTSSPTLLADDSSSIARRAAFATKHLWVTKYDHEERYAAGDYVHQSAGHDGIPAFIAGDESVDGEDIVLWHTFGPTHFPRTEDWPIMPTDYAKMTLKPHGFFDRNPTLNVPAPAHPAACAHGVAAASKHGHGDGGHHHH